MINGLDPWRFCPESAIARRRKSAGDSMGDKRIDRINSEIHTPGFEIRSELLAEVLLDAIGPLLFEPDGPPCPGRQTLRAATEPTPRT